MKRAWHFSTKLNARDIQKCNWFWVPSYDLFASARKAGGTHGHLYFLSWSTIMATIRPITTFFQAVKSSEIENETVNGVEAEAEAMEFENGERYFMLLLLTAV